MSDFDPRITPARGDVAAKSLEGVVPAQRYVEGEALRVVADVAAIRKAPEARARRETELLFGETFTVYDVREDWAWGQAGPDAYVGWVALDALGAHGEEPTHRVGVRATFAFAEPDLKTEPLRALSLNARVQALGENGKWTEIAGGGFVYTAHLAAVGAHSSDWVGEAARFLGAPYLWGGRSERGLDCSALVQLGLAAGGLAAPRDTDMQEKALGAAVDPEANKRRGDLVFWRGHVGVMLDETRLLHANAYHMATAIEPLADAVTRIAAVAGPVTSVKRLG